MTLLVGTHEKSASRFLTLIKYLLIFFFIAGVSFFAVRKSEILLQMWPSKEREISLIYMDLPIIVLNSDDKGSTLRVKSHVKVSGSSVDDLNKKMVDLQDLITKDILKLRPFDTSSRQSLNDVRNIILLSVEKVIGAGAVDEVLISEFLRN